MNVTNNHRLQSHISKEDLDCALASRQQHFPKVHQACEERNFLGAKTIVQGLLSYGWTYQELYGCQSSLTDVISQYVDMEQLKLGNIKPSSRGSSKRSQEQQHHNKKKRRIGGGEQHFQRNKSTSATVPAVASLPQRSQSSSVELSLATHTQLPQFIRPTTVTGDLPSISAPDHASQTSPGDSTQIPNIWSQSHSTPQDSSHTLDALAPSEGHLFTGKI